MLTGAAAVLSVLVALTAIPITVQFSVSWAQRLRQDIRLQWAFGLVQMRLPRVESGKRVAKKKTKKATGRSSGNAGNFLRVLQQPGFRRRIVRFAHDLWHAVRKENVGLRIRLGLGDPAETGQLWALFGPLAGMLGALRDASVVIEPEFLDPTFELDGSGTIRIIPLQFILLAFSLLFSPAIWRAVRQMRAVGA